VESPRGKHPYFCSSRW